MTGECKAGSLWLVEFWRQCGDPVGAAPVSEPIVETGTGLAQDQLRRSLVDERDSLRSQLAAEVKRREEAELQVTQALRGYDIAEAKRIRAQARIDKAADMLRLVSDDAQDWNSVALAKNVLATLTAAEAGDR